MSRRLAREAAFKALFQVDVVGAKPGKAIHYAMEGLILTDEEISFATENFRGTLENVEEIDDLIKQNLVNWELERIASVDRSLLRLAVYEITFCSDIPPTVSIDEALDMTRKYSEESSVSFVNGVLDKIASIHKL